MPRLVVPPAGSPGRPSHHRASGCGLPDGAPSVGTATRDADTAGGRRGRDPGHPSLVLSLRARTPYPKRKTSLSPSPRALRLQAAMAMQTPGAIVAVGFDKK